jgi:hypothetical protein
LKESQSRTVCDRCGHATEFGAPVEETYSWGIIQARRFNGALSDVVDRRTAEGTHTGREVCTKCYDNFLAWWRHGKNVDNHTSP